MDKKPARTIKELTGMNWLIQDITAMHLNSKNTIGYVKNVLEQIDVQPIYDNLKAHTLIVDYIKVSKDLDGIYSSLHMILNDEWCRQIRAGVDKEMKQR